MTTCAERIDAYRTRVNNALSVLLPAAETEPQRLSQAMRYAVLNGGKRLRPLLTYAVGELLGVGISLDAPACAVELIHAYSLVHDDLPAMDDDDFRRGNPTCHKAFDEATAILAGDALQTLAFHTVAVGSGKFSAQQRLDMVCSLAKASSIDGMAGGQALDLHGAGKPLTLAQIEHLHQRKTGALINASIECAVIASTTSTDAQRRALQQFGNNFGLAFQIQDDILDITGDLASFGKIPGNDQKFSKPTYPSVAGLDSARTRVAQLRQAALDCLSAWGDSGDLLRHVTMSVLGQVVG